MSHMGRNKTLLNAQKLNLNIFFGYKWWKKDNLDETYDKKLERAANLPPARADEG